MGTHRRISPRNMILKRMEAEDIFESEKSSISIDIIPMQAAARIKKSIGRVYNSSAIQTVNAPNPNSEKNAAEVTMRYWGPDKDTSGSGKYGSLRI